MVISLVANQWTDVYAATGLFATSKIKIQNQSNTLLYVSGSVVQPSPTDKGEVVVGLDLSEVYLGSMWVKAVDGDAVIDVIEDESGTSSSTVLSTTVQDFSGKQSSNTVFGETVVGKRLDQINIQFQYNISTIDVNTFVSGTGSVSHSQGVASIFTGTGVGAAKLESKASIRYITGHECVVHFTECFNTPEVNTTQQHGLFDSFNGTLFGYQGTQFGVSVRKGGVDTFIPQSSFNRDRMDGSGASGHILNKQAYNIYSISFGWLGIAPIVFSVYTGAEKGWVVAHIHDTVNVATGPHILDPTLPVAMLISRSSGTGANMQMRTSSWRAGIVGDVPKGSLSDRGWVQFVEQKAVSANTLTPVITLRNKPTYSGLPNHIRTRYATVSLSVDGTKSTSWQVLKNPSLTGAVYVDKDANNSVCQYDVSATAVTGGSLVGGVVMGKTDTTRINLFDGDAIIAVLPNETVTLAAKSTGATVVDVFLRWVEEF